jgi:murein DD-endopeptidase MepM/ murein hydrolase activator NlpD
MTMKWFNFQELKNSSLFITPNLPAITTKRYKFSALRLAAYLGLYTIGAWIFLIFILSITSLKDYIFVIDNSELKVQTEKINDLQNRVLVLSEQLQDLASTNERMRIALKLAKKDSVRTNDATVDTLKKRIDKKITIGGDIFTAFSALCEKIFVSEQSSKLIFIEPTHGIITQGFEPSKGHMGVDYGTKVGSPVYASAGGLITFADYSIDSGFMIIIQHDNGFTTIYKHCSVLTKKVRERINQGELIALSGNTGQNTTGPHLHYEIWQDGKPIDPQKFLFK